MRPYLVHPTVVDLRATSLFPADLYSEAMGDVDRLMRDYQIPAPARPPNLTEKEAAVWDTLAMMDITNRRLSVTYVMLLRQFTIAGTAMCDSLKQFNATSWKIYDLQAKVLTALAAAGYMVPPQAPYPTLFTNMSACAVRATPASPANPGGVGVQVQPDCAAPPDGLGLLPLIIGIAIVSYFGYKAISAIANNVADVFVAKEVTRQAALESEYQMLRAAKIAELAEACAKRGGDPQKCLELAYTGMPTELKALRNMPQRHGEEERGLFFWLGVVATAAGAGALGYAFYRWRRKERKRSRQATVPV